MRLALLLLLVFSWSCSKSAKRTTTPVGVHSPAPGALDDSRPADEKGDIAVATNTGDDLSWLGPVYFQFDSAELTQPTRDTLARLADWLAAHPKVVMTIEGHCDEQGTTEYNLGLGDRRARAIVDYLTRLGAHPDRLRAISYGSERPAVDGHDEVAWSKNRRGELRAAP
jgi:peptidoglycan-associated lipoprotein